MSYNKYVIALTLQQYSTEVYMICISNETYTTDNYQLLNYFVCLKFYWHLHQPMLKDSVTVPCYYVFIWLATLLELIEASKVNLLLPARPLPCLLKMYSDHAPSCVCIFHLILIHSDTVLMLCMYTIQSCFISIIRVIASV